MTSINTAIFNQSNALPDVDVAVVVGEFVDAVVEVSGEIIIKSLFIVFMMFNFVNLGNYMITWRKPFNI